MKYVYVVYGTISAISNLYFKNDTIAILGLMCIIAYSILDKIDKNKA
jgi:hypothetical protein